MTITNPSLPLIVIQVVFLVFCMVQPLLVYMVSRVLKRLDDLNEKVKIQNGRVTALEVWKNERERYVDSLIDSLEYKIAHPPAR